LSLIKEMPAGRKKIMTKTVKSLNRPEAYQFIRNEIKKGRQAFVICPLIDPSDNLGVKSVTEESARLKTKVFPDLKINLLHGQLKTDDKEKIMKDFLDKKFDLLVATSVIEVGIDIPNATIMVIEGAERFGLAQLHQFRGRVGRSDHQSYCLLFPTDDSLAALERLRALENCQNGFELAEKDLELRGPGEIYGTKQSGLPELKIATLTDYQAMKLAMEEAKTLLSDDPELKKHPLLKGKVDEFTKSVHLE
ncbi:MAG TPA: helicase-related protein, partial [Patescibacteria group bacterium]